MRTILAIGCAVIMTTGVAHAGGRGSGSYNFAGSSSTSSAAAKASSASVSSSRSYSAGGAGGSATGGSATGGNATIVNAVNGGGRSGWWQGGPATVVAPGMASNGTCSDSISFGVAVGPGGLSFGIPTRNSDCNIRAVAAMYLAIGAHRGRGARAAWQVMCLSPEAQQTRLCAK